MIEPDSLEAWLQELTVPHRARRAFWHLLLSGSAGTQAARLGVWHDDPRVRLACCQVLDHTMDQDSVPDLVERLKDDSAAVRAAALHALACDRCKKDGCLPGTEAYFGRALDLLANDPSVGVRAGAAGVVGKFVHHRADALAALVAARDNDSDRSVRKAAALRAPGGTIYCKTRPKTRRKVSRHH
jgi:HEAT repeat protein